MRPDFEWKPKSKKSAFPTEHANLPLSIAQELAEYLNGIELRVRKGKRAIVTRRVSDSKGRWSVINVHGIIDPVTLQVCLPGVRMRGVTLAAALEEVNRINADIVAYSTVPKVWAIVAVEGEGVTA